MSKHRADADRGEHTDVVELVELGDLAGLREGPLAIKGNATPDEVAAVMTTLRELATRSAAADRYDHWRRNRLTALGRVPPG